jgi:hypothetical protein
MAKDLERDFYAGRYQEVVAATFDVETVPVAATHFVVGALTFVSRLDDALACFQIWQGKNQPDDRISTACRFFIGLAYARSGEFDRSHQLLVRDAFAGRRGADSWRLALLFQGLACQCYFTGRFRQASRFALRAMRAAVDARFSYVSMLSNDLRGHALVQMGQLQRGLSLLEQAQKQAQQLGFDRNVYSIACSIATYASSFMAEPAVLATLTSLLAKPPHDSYSYRALLTDAAVQYAMRGQMDSALTAMQAAHKDALRGDSRRGRLAALLTRISVVRWQFGPIACRSLVDEAIQLVDQRDAGLRAEVLGYDAMIGTYFDDANRVDRAIVELRTLVAEYPFKACAALMQFDPQGTAPAAFSEDELSPLLRAVVRKDHLMLPQLLNLGLLGVIPELLGLAPGRRILLLPSARVILLEDHGNIVLRERPPRWVPLLLGAFARGAASKEDIVKTLWGIRSYSPELHDPPLRTSISRLRSFLSPYVDWINAVEGGYALAVPLVVMGPVETDPEPIERAALDEGESPELFLAHWSTNTANAKANPKREIELSHEDQVLQLLSSAEQITSGMSVVQLARSLSLSQSTLLRALRTLLSAKRIERLGFARATRYRILG